MLEKPNVYQAELAFFMICLHLSLFRYTWFYFDKCICECVYVICISKNNFTRDNKTCAINRSVY